MRIHADPDPDLDQQPWLRPMTDPVHQRMVADTAQLRMVTDLVHFRMVADTAQFRTVTDPVHFRMVADTAQFRTLTDLVYFRTVADLDATVIESAMNGLFIFCSSFGIIILFMIAI